MSIISAKKFIENKVEGIEAHLLNCAKRIVSDTIEEAFYCKRNYQLGTDNKGYFVEITICCSSRCIPGVTEDIGNVEYCKSIFQHKKFPMEDFKKYLLRSGWILDVRKDNPEEGHIWLDVISKSIPIDTIN